MSKGLDALEFVKTMPHENGGEVGIYATDKWATIEKELKDKEKYEDFVQEICRYIGLDNLFPYDNLEEIEKEIKTIADNSHWFAVKQDQKKLKALDIIKEKKVEVGELLENDTFVDYNETVFYTYPDKRSDKEYNPYTYILTQEEFDLLKEVLL